MLISTIKSNTCKLRQENYEFEANFVYIVDTKQVGSIQRDIGLRWQRIRERSKRKKIEKFLNLPLQGIMN